MQIIIHVLILVDCKFTDWTNWQGYCSPCYGTREKSILEKIQRKMRFRYQKVSPKYDGKRCTTLDDKPLKEGSYHEVEEAPCSSPSCPAAADAPFWSTWEEWSSCEEDSKESCRKHGGLGKRTRERSCLTQDTSADIQSCKENHRNKNYVQELVCRAPCTSYSK